MKPLAIALAAAVGLAALATTSAQQQIVGGRVLDNSLQQGSAGFNNTRIQGISPKSYQVNRNRSIGAQQQRGSTPSFAVSSGGGTSVATYGRGGYNTGGTGLNVATYNPLNQGVRVQRQTASSIPGYHPNTAHSAAARTPTYGYRPPTRTAPTRSYAPTIGMPTYTTLRR